MLQALTITFSVVLKVDDGAPNLKRRRVMGFEGNKPTAAITVAVVLTSPGPRVESQRIETHPLPRGGTDLMGP
jgi:hypothetical protein